MIFARFALFFSLLVSSLDVVAQEVLPAETFIQKWKATPQAQLLDVRTPAEFTKGHLATARNADWRNQSDFAQQVAQLDKSKPVFVYCQAGGRSKAAAEWLVGQGFRTVYDLQGGYQSWQAQKEAGTNALPKPEKP